MRDVGFLVPQAHGPDEAFVFDGAPGKVVPNCEVVGVRLW